MQHSPTSDLAGSPSLLTATEIKKLTRAQRKDIASKSKKSGKFVRKYEVIRRME